MACVCTKCGYPLECMDRWCPICNDPEEDEKGGLPAQVIVKKDG